MPRDPLHCSLLFCEFAEPVQPLMKSVECKPYRNSVMNCWNFLFLTSSECLGQQHRLAFFHAAAGNLAFAAGTSAFSFPSRTHSSTDRMLLVGTHLIQGDYWGNAAQQFFQDLKRSWSGCITSTSATLCWRYRACRNEDGKPTEIAFTAKHYASKQRRKTDLRSA